MAHSKLKEEAEFPNELKQKNIWTQKSVIRVYMLSENPPKKSLRLWQYFGNTYLPPCLIITTIYFARVIPRVSSLSFNYRQFSDKESLIFKGDAYAKNGVIQLTMNHPDSVGRVTYNKQLHLWDKSTGKLAEFSTQFSFIINSPKKCYDSNGDGITFFLSQPNLPLPVLPEGSGIGLVSRLQMKDPSYLSEYPFVAVEFETQYNDWDPPNDHVDINIKYMYSSNTTQWFVPKDGRILNASIHYSSASKELKVSFIGSKNNISVNQHLSYMVNWSEVLPEWVEFSFSSATGLFYDLQDTICSWTFSSSPDRKESKTSLVKWLAIGAGVFMGGFGLTWLGTWKKRKRYIDRLNLELAMDDDFERNMGAKRLSHKELIRATKNFADEQKLGEGGFGGVYKGYIKHLNMYVAVKKISHGSKQGVKEYLSEVKIISQLRHKHLVQLVGWCHEKSDLLLIYELMENRSLDSHLFKGKSLLTWKTRYNIARGLASALLYLHEEWEQCVLHRDIKPSNVMLDCSFNAKLGDFGLARLLDHKKHYKTTALAGTLGYIDPETTRKGKPSKESDVYSFGIVVLEIACGRRLVEPNAKEEQVVLVAWVWELYGKGDLLEAADPRLCGGFDEQEMDRLMTVGLWCSHQESTLRPSIRQAVQLLNCEVPIPNCSSKDANTHLHCSFR